MDAVRLLGSVGRGALAGLAGAAAHTAAQVLVEMPITGRSESDAPARLVERVLPLRPARGSARRRRNWLVHAGIGVAYGIGHGVGAHLGLRGARAVPAVFAAQYAGDVALNTALGLYHPWRWSREDWVVDLADKLVLGVATGIAFERLPAPQSS